MFTGDEIAELPTTRNIFDLIALVPGIAAPAAPLGGGTSEPLICSGGQAQGAWSGALSGCSPTFQGFAAHSSMHDIDSLNQGRLQVDGMSVLSGVQSSILANRQSAYIADVGQAQEIAFTLSGALGESETGGTTINIIPRTGGNRYAGNYSSNYASHSFFGRNDKRRPSTFSNRLNREYDVTGAFGGPIVRNRLWFYSSARRQERDTNLEGNYRNLNEGIFGANYRYDPASQVHQADLYQNVNTRLTLQATARDKFNIFWDEQYTCANPCKGALQLQSVEATGSQLTQPLHVAQLSWTNPFTNRILLEAGVSQYYERVDYSTHRFEPNYPHIPRIVETGSTTGIVPGFGISNQITSGSVNNADRWRNQNWQSRASASYITGRHNLKLGYQGQLVSRVTEPYFNDLRLQYSYATPPAACSATKPAAGAVTNQNWCGLFPLWETNGVPTRIYDGRPESEPLGDPLPTAMRPPRPTSITQYIPGGVDERTWSASIYLQEQWTWNRFTLSGALRYDQAQSSFGETCIGPDVHTDYPYCLNTTSDGNRKRGVYFKDITPRWGVAWDVFGTGRTAVKYSMGKYLQGSRIGGIYTASNPASGARTVGSIQREWRDLNGDRRVDCVLGITEVAPTGAYPSNGECGNSIGFGSANNHRRFGRSPEAIDELGLTIGLDTLYCGQDEPFMSIEIRSYCNDYFAQGGSSLIEGWGKRQYEWQYSIGVQHEILPRLSGEVTYNRRDKRNVTVTDLIGAGCDLYDAGLSNYVDPAECQRRLLEFDSPFYDFFGVQAPLDDRLPQGGGYIVMGYADQKTGVSIPASAGVNAITIAPNGSYQDYWNGVDTNFIWRPGRGLRISGGTSTGRRVFENCGLLVGAGLPTGQILEAVNERACNRVRPFQTNVRGTAAYTIPLVDVGVSSTFSVRPGVQRSASYRISVQDVVWAENSQNRVGSTAFNARNPTDRIDSNLLFLDTYGERITMIDLRLSKNVRFRGKRIGLGADIYNIMNSDAARGYCNNFPSPERFGCGGNDDIEWGTITNITTPRFARFQMQVQF